MTVGGEIDENGVLQSPSNLDYFLHFISFPWKLLFAIVPTKTTLGGLPAFVISLLFIGGLTAVVEQVMLIILLDDLMHVLFGINSRMG